MLVVMKANASEDYVRAVCHKIESFGLRAHSMPGAQRTAIGITGNPGAVEPEPFRVLPGVADAVSISQPFKLVSREVKPEDTTVRLGDLVLGGKTVHVIAGP